MEGILAALRQLDPAWLVGGALVGLHSYARFNTPEASRSQTTAGRYHAAATGYTLAMALAWVVLATFPELLGDLVPADIRRLAVPLYMALALTVLLPNLKPLSKYDDQLRAFLQDLARIPYEALRLAGILRKVAFEPDQDTQIEVRAMLRDGDFRDKDVVFAPHRDARTLWTKIATLKHHVDGWQTSSRFARFRHGYAGEFEVLEQAYIALAGKAKRLFSQAELLGPDRQDPRVGGLLKGLEDEFLREATALEKKLYQTISRAMLKCTVTEGARKAALERLGFKCNEPIDGDRLFDRLVGLFLALGAYYMFMLIAFPARAEATLHENAVKGLMIATIYVVAVFWALFPKAWQFGRVNAAGRPIRAYAMSGLFAFVSSLAASLAVGALFKVDPSWALVALRDKWPWGLMAFATAFVTAANADNGPRPGLRWMEAGIQAAAGAVAITAVHSLLPLACQAEHCFTPSLSRLLVNATVTGAVIGFCVPSWYRARPVAPVLEDD
jgi:hypothetical protein